MKNKTTPRKSPTVRGASKRLNTCKSLPNALPHSKRFPVSSFSGVSRTPHELFPMRGQRPTVVPARLTY